MADQFILYVSAADDLEAERALLGRALADIPVSLGWRLFQSPLRDEPPNLQAVAEAHLHLLLLNGDIRAPVGLEWLVARRAGHATSTWRRRGAILTPAASVFAREVEAHQPWRLFDSPTDLGHQVLGQITDTLLSQAIPFALAPEEIAALREWRRERVALPPVDARETGESAIILTAERFKPSGGVVVD